jgi:hypothetical protein
MFERWQRTNQNKFKGATAEEQTAAVHFPIYTVNAEQLMYGHGTINAFL